jgi:hypothetical protein
MAGVRHDRIDAVPQAAMLQASTAPLELILELKALQASETRFSQFDERRVRATIAAIKDADGELETFANNPHIQPSNPYYAVTPAVVQASAQRNRKCLAAYLGWRLQSLSALWWEAQDDRVAPMCTAPEREFVAGYNALISDYLNSFQLPVEARSYMSRPPSVPPSNLVEVRGLTTTSFVSLSSGEIVNIYPGKVLSFPFDVAEPLLQRGVAELVRN